jgi:hypothetical protein
MMDGLFLMCFVWSVNPTLKNKLCTNLHAGIVRVNICLRFENDEFRIERLQKVRFRKNNVVGFVLVNIQNKTVLYFSILQYIRMAWQ